MYHSRFIGMQVINGHLFISQMYAIMSNINFIEVYINNKYPLILFNLFVYIVHNDWPFVYIHHTCNYCIIIARAQLEQQREQKALVQCPYVHQTLYPASRYTLNVISLSPFRLQNISKNVPNISESTLWPWPFE
jgi:hypothetical protein